MVIISENAEGEYNHRFVLNPKARANIVSRALAHEQYIMWYQWIELTLH